MSPDMAIDSADLSNPANKQNADKSQQVQVGFFSQIGDCAVGFLQGAVDNPVTAVVQIVNESTGLHIPALDLANDEYATRSTGGYVGQCLGGVFDCIALSSVTGGLGNIAGLGRRGGLGTFIGLPYNSTTGMVSTTLRMGALGAVFDGVLTPTSSTGFEFWKERAQNALIGFGTFGAMGATGSVLNATGKFAVPQARTMLEGAKFGALTGAASGAAHAELNAVIKKGDALPTFDELASDTLAFGAMGGVFGAADAKLANRHPRFIKEDSFGDVRYSRLDRYNNEIATKALVTSEQGTRELRRVKMADGSWHTKSSDGKPFNANVLDRNLDSLSKEFSIKYKLEAGAGKQPVSIDFLRSNKPTLSISRESGTWLFKHDGVEYEFPGEIRLVRRSSALKDDHLELSFEGKKYEIPADKAREMLREMLPAMSKPLSKVAIDRPAVPNAENLNKPKLAEEEYFYNDSPRQQVAKVDGALKYYDEYGRLQSAHSKQGSVLLEWSGPFYEPVEVKFMDSSGTSRMLVRNGFRYLTDGTNTYRVTESLSFADSPVNEMHIYTANETVRVPLTTPVSSILETIKRYSVHVDPLRARHIGL